VGIPPKLNAESGMVPNTIRAQLHWHLDCAGGGRPQEKPSEAQRRKSAARGKDGTPCPGLAGRDPEPISLRIAMMGLLNVAPFYPKATRMGS